MIHLRQKSMFHFLKSRLMKTLVSKIVVIVALMFATSMNAQNKNQFEAQLKTTLSNVKADEATSIVKGMDELKRMEVQYPDAWLPTYYRVFYALQYAARDPQSDYSSLFLDAVRDDVEALQTKNDVDRSELFTLKGFYYTALITQNPVENGKLYYRNAISCYKSAIGINPSNPRPRILLYMFFDNMSKQTGQPSMNGPKDLETIKELFSKEKQNGLQPAWGRNLIDFCK